MDTDFFNAETRRRRDFFSASLCLCIKKICERKFILAISKKVYTFAFIIVPQNDNMKNKMNKTTDMAALRAPHSSLFTIHCLLFLPPPPQVAI
jgi:hypothetical protein